MCEGKDTFRISPERLLDSIYNGVVVIDIEGRIIYFNRTATEIFCIPEEEAVGKPVLDILPNTGGCLLECMAKGASFPGVQLKGQTVSLVANINPIFEGGSLVGAISVFQEMSQVERMVKELGVYRSVNRQLDAIIESSFDGLFITDGEGKILRCNRSSELLVGHKREDIMGKNVRELLAMGYIDRSVTLEVLEKKASVTILQRLKNGKRIIVTGTPVMDEAGVIEYVVTNERDITRLNVMQSHLQSHDPIQHTEARELQGIQNVGSSKIVAVDLKMRQILETASIAAGFDTTVLLLGESGVGKGVVARFIHETSERRGAPFVKINCGAIPVSLVESELFGYKRGAFTGAGNMGKAGLIETAEGGTLFLDEIGELPLATQVKLLRVLEDRHITPVGDVQPKEVNVRIIAATNRELKAMVSEGTFREDLFFRLNVVPILIPPLRERREDLPVLLNHFLNRLNERFKTRKHFAAEVVDIMCAYSFPGNVRELENLVERLIVLCPGNEIQPEHLPQYKLNRELFPDPLDLIEQGMTLPEALERLEEQVIKRVLFKHGSKRKTAKVLGVNPSTIVRKTRKNLSSSNDAILH